MAKMNDKNVTTGQSFVEYAVLLLAIGVAAVGILRILGVDLRNIFRQIGAGIGMEVSDTCPVNGLVFFEDFSNGLDRRRTTRGGNWGINEEEELCEGTAYVTGKQPPTRIFTRWPSR